MASTTSSQILRACYSFLVPVARFLLRNGVGFREFSELARIAFVDVAGKDYGIRGRPTNISRISAMTGIGRKEVSRLRKLQSEYHSELRVEISPLSDVLHKWYTDTRYAHSLGAPRRLPLRGEVGSFAALVKECFGDVPVGAIKVELLRCGAVVEEPGGELVALRRHVVPERFDEKLITSMAFGLRGLATNIAHNSDPNRAGDPHIERVVETTSLARERVAVMRQILRQRITSFTEEIDDLLSTVENKAVDSTIRVGIGVYYYEDEGQ
jgi:hypothetical protein